MGHEGESTVNSNRTAVMPGYGIHLDVIVSYFDMRSAKTVRYRYRSDLVMCGAVDVQHALRPSYEVLRELLID